jgi:hypothetical protein
MNLSFLVKRESLELDGPRILQGVDEELRARFGLYPVTPIKELLPHAYDMPTLF